MITDLLHRRQLARIGREVGERLDAHPQVQRIDFDDVTAPMQVYCYQDFLSKAECRDLIAMIDADAVPSELYRSDKERDGEFRTSYSCNLDRWDPEVLRIDDRICGLTGIDPRCGETLQGQRYTKGQQFKPHHDFFHTDQRYWPKERKAGGQRSWTAMVFLNEPKSGGETEFPRLSFKMMPRTGMLLIWNNMAPDGRPNLHMLHSGNPVRSGTKYIVTKWFRRGFWV
ncbi:prolyl hydroxylase family protein [Blastomonas sp.]|uniref:prolyl hydroxylase family protein n=1 Tax=Blastomonas sp. TaxID=1909299 RepID=UPI00391C5E6E